MAKKTKVDDTKSEMRVRLNESIMDKIEHDASTFSWLFVPQGMTATVKGAAKGRVSLTFDAVFVDGALTRFWEYDVEAKDVSFVEVRF